MLMTNLKVDCPEPGIYEGVDFATYDQWDAVSNSHLSLLAKSPRHFREGNWSEPSDCLRIGELQHCGVFEPGAITDRYSVMPAFERDPENCTADGTPSESKGTKYYRMKKAQFEAEHEGREIVPRDWLDQALNLAIEIAANEDAHRILNDQGPVEVSIVWDELIGSENVRCKARIDKVARSLGILADLKKCREVSGFVKDIAYRKYHRQLAHYQAGWESLTDESLVPWFIYHESTTPIVVLAAPLGDVSIIQGNNERYELLSRLVECRQLDEWPGPRNPKELEIPAWSIAETPFVAANGEEV